MFSSLPEATDPYYFRSYLYQKDELAKPRFCNKNALSLSVAPNKVCLASPHTIASCRLPNLLLAFLTLLIFY
jgi:hypothetical protein